MRQGSLEEAGKTFASIPPSWQSLPALKASLKYNIALLHYLQAMELLKKSDPSLNNYNAALFLLREASLSVAESEKAFCTFKILEGSPECPSFTQDLEQLRSEIKIKMGLVLTNLGEAKIANAPLKEGIPFLLAGIQSTLSHLDFLADPNLKGKLKKQYMEMFKEDSESWMPLWESQKSKMPQLSVPEEEYKKGIAALSQDRIDQSHTLLIASAESISKLMHELWGDDPYLDQLQKLLVSYQRTLAQLPLQASTLYRLQLEQQQLKAVGEENEKPANTGLLDEALKFLRDGKQDQARFSLTVGEQEIRRMIRDLSQKDEKTPEQILESSIQEQAYALSLTRLQLQIAGTQLNPELEKSQSFVIEIAAPFLPSVLAKEKKEYVVRCQRMPWEKVIPLFDQGMQTAEKAKTAISEPENLNKGIRLQEDTLKYWQEALEWMKKPLTDEDMRCERAEKKREPDEKSSPRSSGEATDSKEVIRLLLNMNQDDMKTRSEPAAAPLKGEKPW